MMMETNRIEDEIDMEETEADTVKDFIVKEGWLMKRGEVIKNWRPRYPSQGL